MNNQIEHIIEYLRMAYTGARMCDDAEAAERISRAIIVLKTPSDVDIFTDEFITQHIERECKSPGN